MNGALPRRGLALAAALAGALHASGCQPEVHEEPQLVIPGEPAPRELPQTETSLYDAEGLLRESEDVVAGLTLPVGLTRTREEERLHVYHSLAPLDKLQRYFGPRLITGEVIVEGDGVVYRNALVRGARGGQVRLDVGLHPVSGAAGLVEVVERPGGIVTPLSEPELARQLEELQRRSE